MTTTEDMAVRTTFEQYYLFSSGPDEKLNPSSPPASLRYVIPFDVWLAISLFVSAEFKKYKT